MDNTHNDAAVAAPDIVTISEARKRLGESAPGRQAFYAAIDSGKLETATPEPKTGKIRIPWSAVESFVAGAFCKVRLPKKPKIVKPGRHREKTAKSAGSEPPPPSGRTDGAGTNVLGTTIAKPSPPSSSNNIRGEKPSAAGVTHDRSPAERGTKKKKGKRRVLHLRELKNNLRHLDFEQTKSIRDWADNRLLNVLHRDLKSAETKEVSENQKEN